MLQALSWNQSELQANCLVASKLQLEAWSPWLPPYRRSVSSAASTSSSLVPYLDSTNHMAVLRATAAVKNRPEASVTMGGHLEEASNVVTMLTAPAAMPNCWNMIPSRLMPWRGWKGKGREGGTPRASRVRWQCKGSKDANPQQLHTGQDAYTWVMQLCAQRHMPHVCCVRMCN